jgi:hypothetical protein
MTIKKGKTIKSEGKQMPAIKPSAPAKPSVPNPSAKPPVFNQSATKPSVLRPPVVNPSAVKPPLTNPPVNPAMIKGFHIYTWHKAQEENQAKLFGVYATKAQAEMIKDDLDKNGFNTKIISK